MKTKQKQIYGTILALAAIAFGADRFVFNSGTPATVDEVAVAAAVVQPVAAVSNRLTPAGQGVATASIEQATAVRLVAARLQELAQAQGLQGVVVRDAFQPPFTTAAVSPAVEFVAANDRTTEFAQRHVLSAVMKTGNGGVAIIDGRAVVLGQAIDGFRLLSISKTTATFARGETTVDLNIPSNGLIAQAL